jgi:hypothetical protein
MENIFTKFVEYKISNTNNVLVLLFEAKKEQPTAFEWTCAVQDFKNKMIEIQAADVPFVYILDVRLMGILSISQIKEFSALLQTYGPFLEKRLICSTVIAQGTIIKQIFDLVKLFYKTVKPLKIVNSMDDAYTYINESKLTFK